jgi:two-component system NtrC family sensor kinase
LNYILTEEGYKVVSAADGVEAIQQFYRHLPDLVILDLEMPRMGGYQVCRALREDPRVASVPIIILTSHDAQGDRYRGLASGADAYLVKNLEDGSLLSQVRDLLRRSPWNESVPPPPTEISEPEIARRLNEMLDRRLFTTTILNRLQQVSSEYRSLDDSVGRILNLLTEVFEMVVCGVWIENAGRENLYIARFKGYDAALVPQFVALMTRSAKQNGISVVGEPKLQAVDVEPAMTPNFPNIDRLVGFESLPLFARGGIFGVLGLAATAPIKFDIAGRELLSQVAGNIGLILDSARLVSNLKTTNADLKLTLEELKTTQLQLVQSERLASIGQLTAGLVHEMNNPMNFIAGNLEHIETYLAKMATFIESASQIEGRKDPDMDFILADLPGLIKDMREGVERAQRIINDLRIFSAGDRGDFSAADLREILESAVNILKYRWEGNIRLEKSFQDIPPVDCNAGQIGQVVVNLVANAIDALTGIEQSEIRLSLREDSGWAVIEIADNGPGIADGDLSRLFQPFFTTKPIGEGVGLGLSISQNIIKRHKGEINVSSKPGSGTVFRVRLPFGNG